MKEKMPPHFDYSYKSVGVALYATQQTTLINKTNYYKKMWRLKPPCLPY